MKIKYQPHWVNGKVIKGGIRDSEDRYEMIKSVCKRFNRPFSVLDIGANFGYFSFRLAEDFDCHVTMIEKSAECSSILNELCRKNDKDNVAFLKHNASVKSLSLLSKLEHFDVVLGMSVIHYFGNPELSMPAFRSLSTNLILEVPVEDTAANPDVVRKIKVPDGAEFLGESPSHVADVARPIYHITQEKEMTPIPYLGITDDMRVSAINEHSIVSDFDTKKIIFCNSDGKLGKRHNTEEDWIPGINLMTYLNFGGKWPNRERVISMVKDVKEHGDIRPWNIILGNNGPTIIDSRREYDNETDSKDSLATQKWIKDRASKDNPFDPHGLGDWT